MNQNALKTETNPTEAEATKRASLITRAKIGAGMLIATMVPPRKEDVQSAIQEAARTEVVSVAKDQATGIVTEVRGDGSSRVVEPYLPPEMPSPAAQQSEAEPKT